jgi:serine/threonine-protein kinase
MDFGIARAVSDASSTMTQTAAVVGTAQYLSPEQARGESVDARSDVYSTGCLLYELLTGRPPFVGESPVSVAYQHVREQAPVPSSIDPDLPPEVDAIVMKALAKSVDQRYQDAAAMKADIDRYLAGHPVQAPAPAPAPVPAPVTGVLPRSTGDTGLQDWVQADEPRRRGPVIALALLLLAIIAAAIFIVPHLIGSAPDQVTVPDLSGMTKNAAQQKIAAEGFALGTVTRENSDTVPKGQVTRQDPSADSLEDPGASINIWISAGKEKVAVPDVMGHNKDDAARELRAAGLKPVLKEKDSDEPEGNVIDTNPDVGTEVAPGTRVTVYYASGPHEIPSVVGHTEEEATSILEKAGFNVSSVPDSTSTEPKGTVTRQSPDAGTPADQGYTVTILVSQYEEPSNEPSPSNEVSPSNGASPPNPGGQ